MGEWWYAAGTQRSGPTDEGTLKRLLQNNTISAETLVWREGLGAWIPLGSEDALPNLLKALPPPLPERTPNLTKPQEHVETKRPDASTPARTLNPDALPPRPVIEPVSVVTATAWRRWFARLFDLWIEVIIVLLLLFFASMLWPSALAWLLTPASAIFLTLALLPAALVLDACVHTLFGNTPGKAILRIRVVTETDARPGWWQYLVRNLSMWGAGLALGLPLLSLFSMGYQARRLRRDCRATYDTDSFHVVQARIGWTRRLVFAVAFAALLLLNTAITIIAEHVDRLKPAETGLRAATEMPPTVDLAPQALPAEAPAAAARLHGEADIRCPEHFYRGAGPIVANRKLQDSALDLCYQGAAVTYSPATYTPLWSAEHLTAAKLDKADAQGFIPDAREEPGLTSDERASAADFDMDRYSAVPLTPATRLATAVARIESSTFASIVPMKDDRLAKRWAELGERVAARARRGGDVYTISGTLFEGKTLSQLNGRLFVPSGFYVAFVDVRANVVGAYTLANSEGAEVKEISLPDLERRAGVLLFPKLPPELYPSPAQKTAKPVVEEAAADFTTCKEPKRSIISLRNAEEGTSTLAFLVDSNGAILDSKIKRPSGYPMLDAAALDAIKLCTFSPARRDGVPYRSWTSVAYVWGPVSP